MEKPYQPLTKSQSLLWIGQELNPDSPMYNMVMTYELNVKINAFNFNMAFQELINRFDALRSVFIVKDNTPFQLFLNKANYNLLVLDFSNKENPKNAYKLWEKERIKKKFDISKCLVDSVLIKLDTAQYIWYINQHHLITDAWSNSILLKTLVKNYLILEKGNTLPKESYNISYQAYCKDAISKTVLKRGDDASHTYWNDKIKNKPSPLNLYHHTSALKYTSNATRFSISLDIETSNKLRHLANEKGIRTWTEHLSLYNIFLTTLFAFLYKVSGKNQLSVGSPSHNRTSKNLKDTVGYFVEIFPLFTSIDAEETFISLLKKVQVESNNFLKHAKSGFSSSALHKTFNVLFNYINADYSDFNGTPIQSKWVHPGHHDPGHHLRLHVQDLHNTGVFKLYLDLNTSIFTKEECKYIPEHFVSILKAFLSNKSMFLDDVSFISKTELQKIDTWNDTSINFGTDETLLSKFVKQVQLNPNNSAVKFEKENLTYQDLDLKSNQVANFLIERNIRVGDTVAISLERSIDLIIYIYGIIKAGAVYLPIDVNNPTERTHFIIKDANVKLLCYNHNNLDELVTDATDCYHTKNIINKINLLPTTQPDISIKPSNLAYIIYTSGSTGMPKGVKCHHKGICNRLHWMDKDYPITKTDVFIQKTPITFDVSVWELFWPLQKGATLVIALPEAHKDPLLLINAIQHYGVTQIHFVPSMLSVFSKTKGIKNCTDLKRIFCSGEVLSSVTVKDVYKNLKSVHIYNLYGPTEASIDVSSWYCDKDSITEPIPIGKPVANTKLYILDKNLKKLPIGIPGELHIAGAQVANGYVNRPELTKEKFIKNPFINDLNKILYKTGDLVRYTDNGIIEYLGRIDQQVKINGIRVELGEIETQILSYSGVKSATVIFSKSKDGFNSLIAFLTAEKDINFKDMQSFLGIKLPKYMVPNNYKQLMQFPLSANGKVDRKALTILQAEQINLDIDYIAPRNEIEEEVAVIWRTIFKLEKISVVQTFIALGGESLMAIQIATRISETFEFKMPITKIFELQTIANISNYIENVLIKLLEE